MSGFTAIELGGLGNVLISQTGSESLTVSAEDNVLPLLTSDVVDKVLKLGIRRAPASTRTSRSPTRSPWKDLTGLDVAGSGSQSGSNIKATGLRVRVAGSGSVTLSGTVDTQDIQMAGSGAYKGSGMASVATTINSAGSGNAEVAVRDRLEVNIIGSGSVTYSGSPQIKQSVLGSGSLQKK
ncbi:MAG: DUF2807 domain-containing protein [Lapillicoccus sp.]